MTACREAERRLEHADMRLHPAEQQTRTIHGRDTLQEGRLVRGAEVDLADRLGMGEAFANRRFGRADGVRNVLGQRRRNPEQSRGRGKQAEGALDVAPADVRHRRQQPGLHVDDDEMPVTGGEG